MAVARESIFGELFLDPERITRQILEAALRVGPILQTGSPAKRAW
jgi:hypothetical protein